MRSVAHLEKIKNQEIMSKNLITLVSKGTEISQIAINDIIEGSGISRSNFYNYFSDIYALLEWTYEKELTPQFLEMCQIGMHREAFKYMFFKIYQDRNFYLNVYVFNKEVSVDKYVERLMFEIYQDQQKIVDRDPNESRWFGSTLAGKAVANNFGFVVKEWMESNFTISLDDIIDFSIFIRNVNLHDVMKGISK